MTLTGIFFQGLKKARRCSQSGINAAGHLLAAFSAYIIQCMAFMWFLAKAQGLNVILSLTQLIFHLWNSICEYTFHFNNTAASLLQLKNVDGFNFNVLVSLKKVNCRHKTKTLKSSHASTIIKQNSQSQGGFSPVTVLIHFV